MARRSRSYGADFSLLSCNASEQFTVVQTGDKVLLFRFAGHLHPFVWGAGGWRQCAGAGTPHTPARRAGLRAWPDWDTALCLLQTDRLPAGSVPPSGSACGCTDECWHSRGEGAGWTWAEDLLLNAPCTVSGACGRGVDRSKCCEGLTPQGSVGTGCWLQRDKQEFMK